MKKAKFGLYTDYLLSTLIEIDEEVVRAYVTSTSLRSQGKEDAHYDQLQEQTPFDTSVRTESCLLADSVKAEYVPVSLGIARFSPFEGLTN